jgi:co-chaperonin GroES (HSP10)
MIQSPANKVIVLPAARYTKNITDLMKRSAIQNGATVDPADLVNIVGEVISIPRYISPTADYKGFSTKDIKIGDVAIFSYKVIYDVIIKQEGEEPIYRNSLPYNGKEYFACDIRNLFGVIRGEEIIMVNGYVMLDDFEDDRIILPASLKKQKNATLSKILYIGANRTHLRRIEAQQGDDVFFNAKRAQRYQINDKKFVILQQEKILGRVTEETKVK